jgi:ubiquinone/menaquinone biosynthesis C-methylase UbiE
MTLTDEERQTIEYYDTHAIDWAQRRKKTSEPSFWDEEFKEFRNLKTPKGKVLELGSGAGREAPELVAMGYEYIGIDTSQELLKIAQQSNPSSHFFYTTAYRLPFAKKSFDAFFSWALLPHIPKYRINTALTALKNVLRSDAIGFIAMREGEGYLQEQATQRWFSYYTQEEFTKILETNGFQIEKKSKKPSRPNLTWLTFFVSINT